MMTQLWVIVKHQSKHSMYISCAKDVDATNATILDQFGIGATADALV